MFSTQPAWVAHGLGGSVPPPSALIVVLGIALILNGLHLLWAASRQALNRMLLLYFSAGDFVWVVGTLGLLASGQWITTPLGTWATLVVAIAVGAFGILQFAGWRENGRRVAHP
ncbi:MAG: hypothetical protein KDH20_17865 [Rhodocyclaceae bacterium]|nr:hypothetical protein [Rhodocyclaceae bacterium]